ncbi:MAG: hypothetical protein V4438_02410 [Patescibacteria group bacterium]
MDNPFERGLKDFKLGGATLGESVPAVKKPDNLEQPRHLATVSKQEIMNLFSRTRELFDFAEQNGIDRSGLIYGDLNNEFAENPYAKELPQKFYPIIADYPGKYWAVSFEDRFDPYYAKGTNMRLIRLSTVPKRSQSDDKIREISISEPATSEGLGNVQFMFIKDSIKNQSFTNINTSPENQADAPDGSAELVYELDAAGRKRLVTQEFNRMDEGIFEWNATKTPVRWLRNLQIKQDKRNEANIQYEDMYILGRHHQNENRRDKRVRVRITALGKSDGYKNILISIGQEIGDKQETLFEDKRNNTKVIFNDNEPWTTKGEIVEFLRQDPNYSFLFDGSASYEKIIELLRQKSNLVTNDWDKPNAVFAAGLEEGQKTIAE